MTIFDLFFLLAMLATAATIAVLLVFVVRGRFQAALRVLSFYAACAAVYFVTGITVSYLRPQRVIDVGDPWCFDDWCLQVDKVSHTAVPQSIDYRIDMKIFSNARGISQRAKGAWIYIIDDAGHLYPPESDSGSVPLDVLLKPTESLTASREFSLPQDAHPIGLITGHGGAYCGSMSYFVIGDSGCLFKKPTMIRIQ